MKVQTVCRDTNALNLYYQIIKFSETPKDFEDAWLLWLTQNDLFSNIWLKNLYEICYSWVPYLTCEYFFAGIHSTQKSDGMNSFLKTRVTAKNLLF